VYRQILLNLNKALAMKKIFLLAGLFSAFYADAQTIDNLTTGSVFMEAYDREGKPFTSKKDENIEGSPMLNNEWAEGEVKFANGILLKAVWLQFNLYENEIYFKKNALMYRFADSVKQFSFFYQGEDELQHNALFRSGYPVNDKCGITSFYQVVEDGSKMQLLRYVYKELIDKNEYTAPGKKSFNAVSYIYIYNVSMKELTQVKADKTSLKNAIPGYEKAMDDFFGNKKKLSEAELIAFIKKMNE
jgi:hypothetical protein